MHAIKKEWKIRTERVHRGQAVEGLECHIKELELYLGGSKDLSRTIPRKAMINTRQEVKTLQAFLLSTLLLVTDCVGVAVEGQKRFITTKHITRGKMEDERQFQNRNNMNSHCTTNVGNSTRHFQTPALSFTPTPTWE